MVCSRKRGEGDVTLGECKVLIGRKRDKEVTSRLSMRTIV